jgi:hypothetical protein
LCALQEPACTTPTARAIVIPVSSATTAADDEVFHKETQIDREAAIGGKGAIDLLRATRAVEGHAGLSGEGGRHRAGSKRGSEGAVFHAKKRLRGFVDCISRNQFFIEPARC